MTNRLVKLARSEYVPAVEEVIGNPAYCTTTVRTVPVTRLVYVQSGLSQAEALQFLLDNPEYEGVSVGQGSWQPVTTYEQRTIVQCYPETLPVEGRDSTTNYNNLPGWNAGARSIAATSGDLQATFDFLTSGVGMVCGLASPGADTSALGSVQHGLMFTGDTLVVVEQGTIVADSGIELDVDTVVSVVRLGDVITYYVDDWSFASTVPSQGPVVLMAVLYIAGDYVDNPVMTPLVAMSARAPWGWNDAFEASAMRVSSSWGWGGSAALNDGFVDMQIPVDMVASDYDFAVVDMSLDGMTLRLEGGFPEVSSSTVDMQIPLVMISQVIDVDMVQADVEFPVDMIAGDYDFAVVDMSLGGLDGRAVVSDDPEGTGSAAELLFAVDAYSSDPVIYAVLNSTLRAGSTLDVLISIDAALQDYLLPSDEANATQVLTAIIQSGIRCSDSASTIRAAVLQYVTNIVTGAVGRYDGYDFSGFCSTSRASFGWKPTGLFKLGAMGDDGLPIQALVDFVAEDFDTPTVKRLRAVYFGIHTDGQLLAKITDDRGDEVIYHVEPFGTESRLRAQQGRSARHWRLQLQIIDATEADLDNIEWVAGSTSRRMTR